MLTGTVYATSEEGLRKYSAADLQKHGCFFVDGHLHTIFSGFKPVLLKLPSEEPSRIVDHYIKLKKILKKARRMPIRCIPQNTTQLLGVKESYTEVEYALKKAQEAGMNQYTAQDHDTILAALLIRSLFPENSFINNEYTVRIRSGGKKVIHVGAWFIDYAGGRDKPLSDADVQAIHEDLMDRRNGGYKEFIKYANELGIPVVLNHPAMHLNTQNLLTSSDLDELTDAFEYLELEGDQQIGNLLTILIAKAKGKTIIANGDDHMGERIGNHFTASLIPAPTPYHSLEAFRAHQVGAGTRFSLPEGMIDPSIMDIMKYQFNGPVKELQIDTDAGTRAYWAHEWGLRKLLFGGVLSGSVIATALGLGLFPAGVLALTEYGLHESLAKIIPWTDKLTMKENELFLYRDYAERKIKQTREDMIKIIDQSGLNDGDITLAVNKFYECMDHHKESYSKISAVQQDLDKLEDTKRKNSLDGAIEELFKAQQENEQLFDEMNNAFEMLDSLKWSGYGEEVYNSINNISHAFRLYSELFKENLSELSPEPQGVKGKGIKIASKISVFRSKYDLSKVLG